MFYNLDELSTSKICFLRYIIDQRPNIFDQNKKDYLISSPLPLPTIWWGEGGVHMPLRGEGSSTISIDVSRRNFFLGVVYYD